MTHIRAKIQRELYKIEMHTPTNNVLIADEPTSMGGNDLGFSPKELLAAALSACTLATLRMYLDHKGWEVSEINVETELIESDGKAVFKRVLSYEGRLTDEQRKRLLAVANACPVHKLLAAGASFETTLND